MSKQNCKLCKVHLDNLKDKKHLEFMLQEAKNKLLTITSDEYKKVQNVFIKRLKKILVCKHKFIN